MSGGSLSILTQQLIYQGPLVVACVLGSILSLVFWNRCREASLVTLLACIVLLLVTFVSTGLQTYLLFAVQQQDWDMEKFNQLNRIVALFSAVIRGVAVALIIVAVFMGRRQPEVRTDS